MTLLLVMAGSAWAQQGNQEAGWWLPHAASDYSVEIDDLYKGIFIITGVMFFLTEGLLVVFCIIYRRRPGVKPHYSHGSNAAEITWTVIPALMLVGIAVWQIPTWNKIKQPDWDAMAAAKDTTVVDTLGQQFKWNFRYPGTKEKFKADNAEYDITNISNLRIPFGNTCLLNLRTVDVIHSVFIPHMRVKQDTVPGLRQRLWFKPNRIQLVNLKKPPTDTGKKTPKGDPYRQQDFEWVYKPEDFEKGGKHFDKKIAVSSVSSYTLINGMLAPLSPAHKHRMLHEGVVSEGKTWDECDWAIGIFEVACAELCGMGHYTMRAFLTVEPRAAHEYWLKDEAVNAGEPVKFWNYWRDVPKKVAGSTEAPKKG